MTRRTALRTSLLALGAVRSDFAASSRPTLKVGLDHPIGNTRTIQIEPCIAAHPSKPGSLIISGAEYVDGKLQLRTYASVDAGKNWITAPMGQLDDSVLSVNNWVVYGGDGTAYCSTLGQPAQKDSFIAIYRSDNEGLSWSNAVKVPGDGYDQPRMIASMERNARTVYVAAGLGGIAVLRSDNSGTSFEAASRISPSNLGNQPRNPLILIDGTLLVPFADFGVEAGRSPIASRLYVIRSENGGTTFDSPRFVADVPRAFPGGGGAFAVDLSNGPFRGRIYAAWESGDFGPKITSWQPNLKREESGSRRELSVAYSTNNGRSWSAPTRVSQPSLGPAFMGCLAVTANGTLGALWIQHEKFETNPRNYRAWFAASSDGGETFSAPRTLSSAISRPNRTELAKINYLQTRSRGGDYIGLAAGADSVFHAAWADARDGLFRIFHASVALQ